MSDILNEVDAMGFQTGPVDSGKVTGGGIGGDWNGSLPRALEVGKIASKCSGKSNPFSSQKRSRVKTASGNVSDHYEGNESAYAIDIPAAGRSGDKLLACIMKNWNNGSNSDYDGGSWLNVNVGGYRYQFGWRVPNHYDHIHVGVKKVGGKSKQEEPKPIVKSKEKKIGGLTQNFYKGEASSNINLLINKLKQRGVTNPMVQAAILGTVGKESGFIPQNEIGYGGTGNNDIRRIFSSTKKLSDSKLDRLKSNDEEFFNYVYGPKGAGPGLGNTQSGDGYKFRGRGFNQITGRGNYKRYGYESNPDSLNSPDGAADATIDFLAKEGSSLNNKFDNIDEAIQFFVTRNAGGRRRPGEESKAKSVVEKFNIGDESTDVATDSDTDSTEDTSKKEKIRLSPLSLLDPIISLARGEIPSLKEETDRIKDIMKKIL
jgi:predicted chitinase